jgi:hypothetical protein
LYSWLVMVMLPGGTSRASMIWTTPPVKGRSPWTRVLLLPWPPTQLTTFPACLTISTCRPPVMLVQLGRSVGVKTGVPTTRSAANTLAWRMWYWRTAVMKSGVFLTNWSFLTNASLLGARN